MLRHFFLFLPLCTLLCCESLRETEAVSPDLGLSYFPLATGNVWEYRVDSIVWFPGQGQANRDSSSTFIREVVADSLESPSGEVLYRVERYQRAADTLPWAPISSFLLSQNEQQALRTEGNLRMLELTFPPRPGARWPFHLYFDEYTLVDVAGEALPLFVGLELQVVDDQRAYALPDTVLQEVVAVEEAALDVSDRELRQYRAQYARGIGLVQREVAMLFSTCVTCCDTDGNNTYDINDDVDCGALPWPERAERGFTFRQQLLKFEQ